MFHQLPKDLIRYILSIVVYDAYQEMYWHNRSFPVGSHFECNRNVSAMANLMLELSLVHPVFHKVLANVSKTSNGNGRTNTWHFDESFRKN